MHGFDVSGAILQMSRNRVLLITLAVWVLGQGIKIVINLLRGKRFNFRWFLGTGGMPSSHAAGVSALATACGMEYGFQSGLFALAAVFAMVTMFDAQGVRRSTGEQAEILNRVIDDMYWHKRVEMGRIREFVGHTPVQVLVGTLLGVGLTILFY
ncbi:MAG: divergent PAP2 family protein [Candidatus Omnitrophica bacterium]|nr:divergent PAP2 family protein [Candidatus Omnitrophota bacterium]